MFGQSRDRRCQETGIFGRVKAFPGLIVLILMKGAVSQGQETGLLGRAKASYGFIILILVSGAVSQGIKDAITGDHS